MKILVDEMFDGIDEKLRVAGYDAYSVRKLWLKGEELHSDFSIMKYAERNHMVLVTEDEDNIDGCIENKMRYAKFGQNQSFESLLAQLEKLKS